MNAFVVLEGGEGVGKTTQRKLLEAAMPKLYPGRATIFTREPGGSPRAEAIRRLALSDEFGDADGNTIFGLMTAARYDHIASVIRPQLDAGAIVISDRFVASTYAYQIVAQEQPGLLPAYEVHRKIIEATLPCVTIIFDMDPVVAAKRVLARDGQEMTHFDARSIEFQHRLREGYKAYAREYEPWAVVTIDADRPQAEVHDEVVRAITHRIA